MTAKFLDDYSEFEDGDLIKCTDVDPWAINWYTRDRVYTVHSFAQAQRQGCRIAIIGDDQNFKNGIGARWEMFKKKKKDEPEYKNNPTVVVVSIVCAEGIVIIKRNNPNDPFYGKWALPGGFQNGNDKEDMRAAAVREIQEEIGLDISDEKLILSNTSTTDEHGTNLLFFMTLEYEDTPFHVLKELFVLDSREVADVSVTASAPYGTYPLHAQEIKNVIKATEEACYD